MGVQKRMKVSRMVKMHSNEMEDITEASAGEIFAIFGLDCGTGDTLCDGNYINILKIRKILHLFENYIMINKIMDSRLYLK